ncbi:MAG: PAS domain S-box protein [Verrucomicrobia bacterium]|nr:PAS domain S-box protein [Verrucomicrobiota bacterium]
MPAEPASEKRERVLHRFAHELSAASGLPEAARLLAQAADELIGWDCCILELWDEEMHDFVFIYAVDIMEGKRTEVPVEFPPAPTPMLRAVAAHGPKLLLRDGLSGEEPKLIPFGDMKRRSASMLFVPIRQGGRVFGLFTTQSYTPQAYSQDDLTLLQTLADYGTGAIARIRAQEQLRASEERLRENQDRFRLALEVAAMGTWDWNIVSGEVHCSDNLGPLFGLPAREHFADYREFIERILPEDRAPMELALQRALETGEPFSHEFRVARANGQPAWLLGQGRCYAGPDGKIARLVGATLDITGRRQAQEALRASEERFAKVFHSGMAAISIADLETGRYLDVNQRWLEMLGFTREEVIGRTGLELGVWPVPADRERMLAALHSGGALRDWQCRWVRKDGQVIDAATSFETMAMGGRQYYIGLTHDITEKLKLEEELRQAHRMESVGQLAAGIAHDFNNILTIISGGAALILTGRLSEEAGRNATRQIQFAADRAAGLTRQLLTFSRRQVIQRRDLDLNAAVTNITQFLANLLGENIEVEMNFTPGLPFIHADPGMIEQVIMNLAVNARDAMPRGGRLAIRTELNETDTAFLTRRTGARRGRFVVLAVSDNGTGIGSSSTSRILSPPPRGCSAATVAVPAAGESTAGKNTRNVVPSPARLSTSTQPSCCLAMP